LSYVAFNAANHTALVTDENDDAVRVISLDSKTIVATITLPGGSEARGIAVNDAGTLAAVALSNQASVALIDLAQNQPVAVIGTGYYPSHVAFSGTKLLVTNGRSGTVSVIDSSARVVLATVNVGFGPSGIAANGNLAVVANMQGGSISLIRLTDYGVTTISLPAGSRPHEVALAAAANKAVITAPMSGSVLLLELGTQQITPVDLGVLNAMGPGAVAVDSGVAYVASQMTSGVITIDLNGARVLSRFSVDPGPRALALDSAGNRLLVMAQGTGTLDIVDLGSHEITARVNAVETERNGNWTLPLIQSVTPISGAAGSSFTLTITGSNLSAVKNVEFRLASMPNTGTGGMGGGMMGGSGMGQGMGGEDDDIKVTNVQVNAAGTEITASVQILGSASAGTLQIRLETDHGDLMGPMAYSLFTVTK
jgi:YVTN family beta-propeller protein